MREGDGGRNTVFPWGDTRAVVDHDTPAYAVGDTIFSGGSHGTVVSVDAKHAVMAVVWNDANTELDCDPNDLAITYPMDATYLRKAMPWE